VTDNEQKVLSRADFLAAAANRKRELVDVPDLGGVVYLRELSAKQILAFNDRLRKLQAESPEVTPSNSVDLMAVLISMTACDAAGGLLFTEEDIQALAENNLNLLITLSAKAMEVSGMGSREIDEVTENLKKVTDSSPTD
jgi:hypothetical protein